MSARREDGALPAYYTSLPPFRTAFSTGLPVLTYHRLGRRQRGTRIKGLTVSAALFERQLAELRAAGITTATLDDLAAHAPGKPHRLAITFDDGYRSALDHALRPLAQHGFVAIQFLCAGLLGETNDWDLGPSDKAVPLMSVSEVREWLAAGHRIGSHTLTHARLTHVPLASAREEITASRKRLEDAFGVRVVHFCYPYGAWNATVRDLVIEAGYSTACTTEPGVNGVATDRFALHRFTARYASRTWRNLARWLATRVVPPQAGASLEPSTPDAPTGERA